MKRAAERYADGVKQAKLQFNDKLTRAMAERVAEQAHLDYEKQTLQTLKGNVRTILSDYHQRDRQIRRDGARMAWLTCPFIALVFGALSWFNFHHGDAGMGLLYAVGALAFLVLLVLAHRQQKG